jgi:uncharacterized membrane protein YphA (DoxX/SURF4 family)
MKAWLNRYLAVAIRLALGGVFVYAGAVKVIEPVSFAGSIAAYKLLPYFGNFLVAAVLPWLEVICGLLLIVGCRLKAAALIIILLNLVFMAALTAAIVRGLDIDCGCFRQGGAKSSPWLALLRDALFLLAAIYTVRTARQGAADRGK